MKPVPLPVHPLQSLRMLSRLFLVLLIPWLRQLLTGNLSFPFLVDSFLQFLLALNLLLFFCFYYKNSFHIQKESHYLSFSFGIFQKRAQKLPFSFCSYFCVSTTLLSALFGAVIFEVQTYAQQKAVSVYLFGRSLSRFLKSAYSSVCFRCRTFPLILCAISDTHAVSGIFFTVLFFRRVGHLLGEELRELLTVNFSQNVHLIALGIPPLTAGLIWIFSIGWFVSFLRQLLSTVPFSCRYWNGFALIRCGCLPKKVIFLRLEHIGALVTRRSPILRLCSVVSIAAHVPKKTKRRAYFLPLLAAVPQKDAKRLLSCYFPSSSCSVLVPPPLAKRRYVFPSFCLLAGLSALLILLSYFHASVLFTALPALLFFLCLRNVLLQNVSFAFSFLQINKNYLQVRQVRRFSVINTYIPREQICGIQIRRSYFQRRLNLCTVHILFRGANGTRCNVRHLNFSALCSALQTQGHPFYTEETPV